MTNGTHALRPRIGVGSFASPLEVGADRAPGIVDALCGALGEMGCEAVSLGVVDTPASAREAGERAATERLDALCFAPACWYEDYLVLDLIEECSAPFFLWPQPGMETGALCGAQQATCYLHELEHPYAATFGTIDDPKCRDRAAVYFRAAALYRRLRRTRVGLAGHHVSGMTHTVPNEMQLKKAVGPRVVPLDLPDLLERAEAANIESARASWQDTIQHVGTVNVAEEVGIDAMRMYRVLRDEIEAHGLDAITVGCYPSLMGRPCLAASLLADEGIPLSCEGDVHGSIGQLMLQLLTGEPTHCTDWLDPLDDGSVVFTHCGSGSFGLAENPSEIALEPVRLMGEGVCALYTAKPGPVTLIGLTPRGGGYRCAVLEGEAVSTEMVFPGNPVRVQFSQPIGELLDWIHAEGIGHHWMIGYGHVSREIDAWAAMTRGGVMIAAPNR